jgi:predicted Zn-dependent protease
MSHGKGRFSSGNAERLAATYLAAHEADKALEFLEKAVREKPSAGLWLLLGKILYDKGAYYDAGEAFGKSAALDPMDGQSYLMLAYCMIKLEDRDASVAALMRAMDFSGHRESAGRLLDNLETVWIHARRMD